MQFLSGKDFLQEGEILMAEQEAWNGFKGRLWKEEINVRDFIQKSSSGRRGGSPPVTE